MKNDYKTVKKVTVVCFKETMFIQENQDTVPATLFFYKINDRIGLTHDTIKYTHDRTTFTHNAIGLIYDRIGETFRLINGKST